MCLQTKLNTSNYKEWYTGLSPWTWKIKVKELLYRAFVLPHFYYCSQVWHHCGSRNTKKIEKVNERALRYVYKDKTSAYYELLQRIGLGTTLENRRVQDMLITINACFQGTAPTCI